uniref:Uncharacterized protein n=1 Tax=Aegilops tauschii subsp. strangulata TaxID=200361 RepID=A0A453JXC9_AEGTS
PAARLPPTPRPPSSPDSRQSPPPASPLLRTAGAALASRPRRTPPPLYSLYSALSSTSRLPAQPAVRPSRGQGTRARRCRPHTVIRSSSSAAEALHYNTALRCRPHPAILHASDASNNLTTGCLFPQPSPLPPFYLHSSLGLISTRKF